jgi:hypothetical protein
MKRSDLPMSERDLFGLKQRIALVLSWPIEDVNAFSLSSLRDIVRPHSAKLAHEINRAIQNGSHIA